MKIGFACQRQPQRDEWKVGRTTIAQLRKLTKKEARDKLSALAIDNGYRLWNLVNTFAIEPPEERMMRVGSGLWPMAEHPDWNDFGTEQAEQILRSVGERAKELDLRLSFHPGQFCAIASVHKDVVKKSIRYLNMEASWAGLLGATNVNIHCWGRGGTEAFRANIVDASDLAQNLLTIENDEFGVGLPALLDADMPAPIVVDFHHHWINTGSWKGLGKLTRAARLTWPDDRHPKVHYSYPKDHTVEHRDHKDRPVMQGMRSKARRHSDNFSNREFSEWVLRLAHETGNDVMCEAKDKDLASHRLAELARELGLVGEGR